MNNTHQHLNIPQDKAPLRDYLFIPLFFTLYLAFAFFNDTGFNLEHFAERPISLASAEGIDVTKRSSQFYKILLFILSAGGILFQLTVRIQDFLRRDVLQILNGTAMAGFVLLFFHMLGTDVSDLIKMIIAVQIAAISGNFLFRTDNELLNQETFLKLFIWTLAVSYSVSFIPYHVISLSGAEIRFPLWMLFCVYVIMILFFIRKKAPALVDENEVLNRLALFSLPLAFIPASLVLATEISLIFNQAADRHIKPLFFYLLLLGLILIWAFFRYRHIAKQKPFSGNNILSEWLAIISAGIALMAFYKPTISVNPDLFEDANRVLPVMQYFEFGKIPFIDSFASHALQDFLTGFLYAMLNGYHPLGGFVYNFIIPVTVVLLIYKLVFRITKSIGLAFFISVCYPYTDFIFPNYYNLIPLSILALLSLTEKQSVKNYVLFFLSVIFMIFWRLDLGAANLIASGLCFILLAYASERFKVNFRNLIKGFMFIAIPLLLAFSAALMLRQGEVLSRFSEALGYVSSAQSYGLRDLAHGKDIRYFSLYFFMPMAVILAGVYAFLRIRKNHFVRAEHLHLSVTILFMSLFFIANFQRGLVRHTLAENWDTALTSFGFFIIAASVLYHPRLQSKSPLLSFYFLLAATLVVVNYKYNTPDFSRKSTYSLAVAGMRSPEFHKAGSESFERITDTGIETHGGFDALKKFLNLNIPATSTFLDFSNTPMLYHYTSRIVPDYFCQLPHTAHNEKMQNKLLDNFHAYDIPVVAFSNVPYTYWDALDGIPNSVRHYRIAEYIYRNYRPETILNKHTIWVKKDAKINRGEVEEIASIKDISELEISNAVRKDSNIVTIPNGESLVKGILKSPIHLKDEKSYCILIDFAAEHQGSMTVITALRKSEEKVYQKTEMRFSSGLNNLFVMIERESGENIMEEIELRLQENNQIRFLSLKVIGEDLPRDYFSFQPVDFNLKKIPFYWGNYDDENLASKSKVLNVIVDNALNVKAGHEIRFRLPENPDKSEGNYILITAKAAQGSNTDVIMNYGKSEKKNGGFSFNISSEPDLKKYKIRISTQFNWWNSSNDWLSLYPISSDIEIKKIELLSGD
ncbi:MAG: hypothetical protein DWQ44_04600 [Bacteroidetes bacterium]|nr:MAG: hypothetical protein DWQ33_11190 [Bacteroidota bacterium]REK00649.1 MAG: hypothetical protein DWQ39_10865 [Bacteroidota bacterium]REK35229.1 MAG: hypothetical protein DWQ44_04600 [Bacteroidota bacterium]REK48306.1 MAG: hypothetical protein DWQ48_10800 [Bacteroidota bacterium]